MPPARTGPTGPQQRAYILLLPSQFLPNPPLVLRHGANPRDHAVHSYPLATKQGQHCTRIVINLPRGARSESRIINRFGACPWIQHRRNPPNTGLRRQSRQRPLRWLAKVVLAPVVPVLAQAYVQAPRRGGLHRSH